MTLYRWTEHTPREAKPSGAKHKGLLYERRVEKHLQAIAEANAWTLHSHRWIEGPHGLLQPDFLIEREGSPSLLLECKLTWTDSTTQLSKYLRALSEMGYSCVPLLVCRNLTPAAPSPIHSLEEASPWAAWHLWI